MSNPVAIRYDFDGYGYKYMDSGSGSDWQTRVEGEPLYTHPHPDNLGFALSIIDQQKLEISELKQYTKKGNGLLAECNEHMGKLQALILKQDARIAELEKDLAIEDKPQAEELMEIVESNNEPVGIHSPYNACCYRDNCRKQADLIVDLRKLLEHSVGADCREMRYIQEIENRDSRITELEEIINACYTVQKMQAEENLKGADRIAELEKELKRTKFAWNLAENELERYLLKAKAQEK
jgi:hypothetical protein